jgi:hypothetical protein
MNRSFYLKMVGALLVLCSCQQRPDYATTVIDRPGTFDCFQHRMLVTVSSASNDVLNYTVSRKQSKVGPAKPALQKGTPWIIYPESVDSIWVYDGTKDVTLIEFGTNGAAKFTSNQVISDLLKRAPRAFLERLPPDMTSP